MPSLCFTSFDRLIEPASTSPPSKSGSSTDRSTPFSFYPPLYATPPQQRPPSPTAFSPSPYVLNFKRRAPVQHQQQNGQTETRAVNLTDSTPQQQCQQAYIVAEEDTGAFPQEQANAKTLVEIGMPKQPHEASRENGIFEMELEKRDASPSKDRAFAKNNQISRCLPFGSPEEGNMGVFSVVLASPSPSVNEELEFFDAPDSAFSDNASDDDAGLTPGRSPDRRSGRTTARLAEEVEGTIKAEEKDALLQRRWNAMVKQCASIGVSPSSAAENILRHDTEILELFSQELLVARLVAGAVTRAAVRAEKEEEIERIFAIKNREISRLWDKLQNLELVNREMSQRNQEVTELTQRRKKRRQRRRKLALSGFCAAFVMGTAGLLCYKYMPWDQAKQWESTLHKVPVAVEVE